jgi:tetratricopeptide (TPR) repeat protein
LLGRATPCVGRERELRALVDLLDECQGEPVARAVLVTAPAGAGKSRLLHELSNAIAGRAEPFAVWSGRGDPMSAGSAFSLVASALRGAAGVHGGEPLGARRGALAAWTARFVAERDRGRVAAFLGEILGAPFPDDGMPLLRGARESPGVMAEQVRRAFEDLVAGACAAGPLLIALEDLHWGDLPSVKLVDAALARLHDRPLFVVALARPEVHDLFPKLWVERGAQEIRLGELTRRAAERLVRHALGDAAPAETVARVVGRAAGNAFYLEELIRAVAEGRGGELPETVLAMAQARLDALGAEDRGLLRAASVFGETFWEGGVAALLGASGPASRLRERLDALADREVLVRRDESRFAGERELSFRHALLRDSAYAMLSGDDRALGHRLAGAWLEARGEGDALVLAEHFERGGEGGRAAAHYARAARQAIAGGDPACVGRAERGLACGAEGEVRWELLALLSRCCWLMGDLAGSAAAGDEVLRIAPPGSLPHAMMLPGKIMLTALAGDRQGLVDATAQACDAPLSAGIAGALAEACYGALTLSPDLPPALRDRLRERLSEIERAAPPGDRVALGYAAAARACLALHFDDDLERAAELQGAAVEHLEAAGEVGICARLRGTRAGLFALLGAFERADEEYGRALAQAGGAWMELWTIRCGRAWCFGDEARAAQAAAEATWALEHAVTPGWQGWTRQVLARALRRLGDLPAAEREVLAALQGPQAISYQRADTLATLAAIRLAQGRPAEALAAAREALSDREGFARPFQDNLLRLVLAEALLACGDSAAGDAALAAARARLLRLAGNIRDPALREAFLQRIDENRRTLALAEARLGPA